MSGVGAYECLRIRISVTGANKVEGNACLLAPTVFLTDAGEALKKTKTIIFVKSFNVQIQRIQNKTWQKKCKLS